MKFFKTSIILAAMALTNTVMSTASAIDIGSLETVTEFNDYRGAGITITPAGRIIVSMHPLDGPKTRVVEVMANGSKRPFPTKDWADGPEIGEVGLDSVIGVHSDSKGVVWILDMGSEKTASKLVAWDSVNSILVKTIVLTKSALVANSFLQDFAIDEKRGKIYIADMTFGNFNGPTKPAIVVVDLKTGQSTRILENTPSFVSPDRDVVIEASLLASKTPEGKTNKLRFGLNPIALDDKAQWLYFGAVNGETIYRVPVQAIADQNLSDKQRAAKIEKYGPKNPSDGILYAPGGGLLVTDLENNAIGLTTKNSYKIMIQDKRLSWPDSLAISNGYIYVTHDQLHQHPAFSQGLGNAKAPYKLMRFRYQP
jgi:sugar lactone lactonase YvrE